MHDAPPPAAPLTPEDVSHLEALHARAKKLFPIRGKRGGLDLYYEHEAATDPRIEHVGPFVVTPWVVSVSLRATRIGRGLTAGTVGLCDRAQVRDPRLGDYLEGMLLALRAVLERASSASMDHWAIGYFIEHPPLDVLGERPTAQQFREYFLTYPWFGRLLPDLPASPPGYERAPFSAASFNGVFDVEALWSWISQHSRRTFVNAKWDDAMIRALPKPVRTLAGAHVLHSMVGGNGFEVYLSQANGPEIRRCYEALGELGAVQLQALMAKGIALAASQGAEFVYTRTREWAQRFPRTATAWGEIDGHEEDRSYALLKSELVPAAQRYAEKHRAELVRE